LDNTIFPTDKNINNIILTVFMGEKNTTKKHNKEINCLLKDKCTKIDKVF